MATTCHPFVDHFLAQTRCNKHLLGLGQEAKASLIDAGLIGYQFGTVGVSDGISMGTGGMRYSLQSRDLIADQVETAAGGHHLDGMVTIPGCDKNMPGVLMARESFLHFLNYFVTYPLFRTCSFSYAVRLLWPFYVVLCQRRSLSANLYVVPQLVVSTAPALCCTVVQFGQVHARGSPSLTSFRHSKPTASTCKMVGPKRPKKSDIMSFATHVLALALVEA